MYSILKVHLPLKTDPIRMGLRFPCVLHNGIALIGQNVSDLAMGRTTLASRSDFFAEIFAKKIILGEANRTQ